MEDKISPLGRNEDDEYDFEGAQIVDSNMTAEELEVFTRRKRQEAPTAARTFFAADAAKPAEDESEKGPVKFRGKTDRAKAEGSWARPSTKSKGEAEGGDADNGGKRAG